VRLTPELVRSLIKYEPDTGHLIRLVTTSARARAGAVAGTKNGRYVYVRVGGNIVLAHRLAWLWMTGMWPEHEIDHKNGNGRDNRWENLRDVTSAVNKQNQRIARSSTGLLGVSKRRGKYNKTYVAHIQVDRRNIYLGDFRTPEEAHAAYIEAKRKWHPGGML
jgi:hypothetical protein